MSSSCPSTLESTSPQTPITEFPTLAGPNRSRTVSMEHFVLKDKSDKIDLPSIIRFCLFLNCQLLEDDDGTEVHQDHGIQISSSSSYVKTGQTEGTKQEYNSQQQEQQQQRQHTAPASSPTLRSPRRVDTVKQFQLNNKNMNSINSSYDFPTGLHRRRKILQLCLRRHMEAERRAVLLVCCWQIITFHLNVDEAFRPFEHLPLVYESGSGTDGCIDFFGILFAIQKVFKEKPHLLFFSDLDSFNILEYEHFQRKENGFLSWISKKLVTLASPQSATTTATALEQLVCYLKNRNVSLMIRLGDTEEYDPCIFQDTGIEHLDISMSWSEELVILPIELESADEDKNENKALIPIWLSKFLQACEQARGAVAVHSTTGLGRAVVCIACYFMKHVRMTAQEAISWIRLCRPGSFLRYHEFFLQQIQPHMWQEGEEYDRISAALAAEAEAKAKAAALSSVHLGSSSLPLEIGEETGEEEGGRFLESNTRRSFLQINIGNISLGGMSLLGTKGGGNSLKNVGPEGLNNHTNGHGNVSPTALKRRPMTQGSRRFQQHLHQQHEGIDKTASLRGDFAAMRKFLHQSSTIPLTPANTTTATSPGNPSSPTSSNTTTTTIGPAAESSIKITTGRSNGANSGGSAKRVKFPAIGRVTSPATALTTSPDDSDKYAE
jgi:hypothetical protein